MSPRDGPSADSDDEDLAELCRNFQMGSQHQRGGSQSPSKGSEEASEDASSSA